MKTISALSLAILVLLSSTSFMVGLHFCMGDIEAISLFSKVESKCEKQRSVPACHKHQSDCCQDETIIHDGDEFKNAFHEFKFEPVTVIAASPVKFISDVIPSLPRFTCSLQDDHPPGVSDDLTISLKVFRI